MIEVECFVFRGPHESFGAHVIVNGRVVYDTAMNIKRTDAVKIKAGDLLKIPHIGDMQTMLCLVYKHDDGSLRMKPINLSEFDLDIVMAVMEELSTRVVSEDDIDQLLLIWRTL